MARKINKDTFKGTKTTSQREGDLSWFSKAGSYLAGMAVAQ